jgi:hypothetical protein
MYRGEFAMMHRAQDLLEGQGFSPIAEEKPDDQTPDPWSALHC